MIKDPVTLTIYGPNVTNYFSYCKETASVFSTINCCQSQYPNIEKINHECLAQYLEHGKQSINVHLGESKRKHVQRGIRKKRVIDSTIPQIWDAKTCKSHPIF